MSSFYKNYFSSSFEVTNAITSSHEKLNPSNKWAEVQENKDENEEDNLFQTTEPIVAQRTSHLPQNIISIRRLMDANREDRSKVGFRFCVYNFCVAD